MKLKNGIFKTKMKSGGNSWGFMCNAPHDANGKRRQLVRRGFEFERDAIAARDKAVAAYDKSLEIPRDDRPFATVFRSWLQQHGSTHWGKLTFEVNLRRGEYAIRKFGNVPIQQLRAERIERDLCELLKSGGRNGRPLSGKSVREIAALVSGCMKRSVRLKIIERNPMEFVDVPKGQRTEAQFLEADEYEGLLSRLANTRYFPLAVFAAASGARRGEMLALRWSDIDLRTDMVTISKSLSETHDGLEIKTPKSGKTRHIRLSGITMQVLLKHRDQIEEEKRLFGPGYIDRGLVFPTPTGDYYVPGQITNRVAEFMKQAGIVGASLHKLRHFSASMMLSQKVPITTVSRRLGHASPQITLNVYSHAMREDGAAAVELWDDATAGIIDRTQTQSINLAERKLSLVITKPAKSRVS
jgi:integrase